MSTAALQQFVTNLKSRHEHVRYKTVNDLSLYVKSELREATADEINNFLDEFNHHIFEMVSSNDVNEKKGGILAIVCLIGTDVGNMTSRISRFANYLRNLLPSSDVGVMELVAKAMGHLAVVSGSKASEYVDFEVKRAFEWLQEEKTDGKRHAAVLVLKELATTMPTYFYQQVSQFFDLITKAIQDPKVAIREGAVEALRAALVVTAQREVGKVGCEEETNTLDMGINLTQEDMDLIEVLWKQDVDLGFTVDDIKAEKETIKLEPDEPTCSKDEDLEEKIKSLELLISENAIKQEKDEDPWAGINYTIDTETGEYVVKTEVESEIAQEEVDAIPLPLPEYYLDEALRVIDLGDERVHANTVNLKDLENLQADINGTSVSALDHTSILPEVMPAPETVGYLPPSQEILDKDPDDDFDFFNIIDTPVPSNPLIRTVSIEQRWHDLANLLNASAAENDHGLNFNLETAREVLLHNATLPTPIGDLNSSVPFSMFGGTSFRSPLSFLTNGSEPMGDSSSSSDFKLESLSDIGFYQNNSAEINQTDGFLSSMLNDEDLQLMDMALNEGMYTMRMLDGNTNTTLSTLGTNNTDITMSQNDIEHHDTSSDSAVSSMGSERAPSLSEGEWGDGSSDSGQSSTNNYMTDYPRKLRRYENSFNARQLNRPMESSDSARIPPVAQKKHQMFGKRIFQDQNSNSSHAPATSLKYEHEEPASSYTATNQSEGAVGPKIPDFKRPSFEFEREDHSTRSPVQHNHTYHLPAESSADMERPVIRDKVKQRRITTEEEHMSRDAKRAKALNVPMTVEDIVNLPMDEFNEKLSKYDLNEAQLSLIRDIRRRGKNKVAAQNCRKRKLDQILSLADEVKEMKDRKTRLINEHEFVTRESKRYRDKYQQLYRHVFQNLRDAEGNPYSPYAWSLQTSADGSIILVPRSNSMSNTEHKDPHKEP